MSSSESEGDEADPHLPLATKSLKLIQKAFEDDFSRCWNMLVEKNRLMLLEVCCAADSVLTATCQQKFGEESARRVSFWNGGNVETPEGVKLVKDMITEQQPRLVWLSPECGPYSPLQHLNQKTPEQRQSLDSKRKQARKQYEGVSEIAQHAHSLGLTFVIELSERCEGWGLPWFHSMSDQVPVYTGVCKGCQVGLRGTDGKLLGKGWRVASNSEHLAEHMNLKCPTNGWGHPRVGLMSVGG